jgi:hypothetical protein
MEIMNRPVFKNRTRLYTNVHFDEHQLDLLVISIRKNLVGLLKEFHVALTDDAFVDALLSGGNIIERLYPFGAEISREVNPALLGKTKTRLLMKLFQSPRQLIRKVSCLISKDGELCIDIEVSISLNDRYMDDLVDKGFDKEAIPVARSFISGIFNVLSAMKHLFLSKTVSLLTAKHGVDIESTCDVSEIEHIEVDDHFEKRQYKVVEERTDKFSWIWDIQVDKVI